ncbi:MAG: efflux RND transporter periplasmic adaptor subunit [Piscinibacter sp.]|nr:efflux RND transporter periplasmic adaptor subunit [Piscinibacter sp.]
MTNPTRYLLIAAPLAAALAAVLVTLSVYAADDKVAPAAAVKPALTVTVTQPQTASMTLKIAANGNVAAWQEASIGTEANGLRLADVKVNVGDVVRRGQVLATFAPDTIAAELAQTRAAVAEAEAMLAEASANAQRARELQATGALSAQQINQYLTAERTAQARLDAQRAAAKTMQLRLAQTQVLAPDAGVISARSATVGAVLPAGQELFRLIRGGRLEWRAEVAAADLAQIKPGQRVTLTPAGGSPVVGKVRMLAPTVDAATRNGLVYVDLPDPGAARAGMFARGDFEIGTAQGLSLPQSAVQLRDGFSYVLQVGADSKVTQTKVSVGRRWADRVEITGGLDKAARVVASGGGFLGDGDTVRVVDAAPAVPQKTASSR